MSEVSSGDARGDTRQMTSLTARLSHICRFFLDLLYPPQCAGCGRVGDIFCQVCQSQVSLILAPVCPRCGRPATGRGGLRADGWVLCASCSRTNSNLDGIIAVAAFASPVREAIHQLKYRNQRRVADPLGLLMSAFWRDLGPTVDAVVPVPLHASRLAERGYNQSALLAAVAARELGLPMDQRILERNIATQPQAKLGFRDRQHNVNGAFRCRADVTAKRFVLIDDVCTTGATLEASAHVLRAAGAQTIWGVTLARSRWRPDRA